MKHQHAVQILEALLKDSKFFLGFAAGRNAIPIVPERHNVYKLLADFADVTLDHTVDSLETLFKDSKIFQGIALARGCYPFAGNAGKTRMLFQELALAVMDVPQDDMFTARYDGSPVFREVYRCPICDNTQPASGFNQACTGCGVVRSTAYTPALVRDTIAGVTTAIPLEMIAEWSLEQLEAAVVWARELVDAHTPPDMPYHVKKAYEDLSDDAGNAPVAKPETDNEVEPIEEEISN